MTVEPIGVSRIVEECVEVMTLYRDGMKSKERSSGLDSARQEIRRLAGLVARMSLRSEEKARMILRPVESGLGRLFGPRVARGLFAEFVSAFWVPSNALHSPLSLVGSQAISRPAPARPAGRPSVGPR